MKKYITILLIIFGGLNGLAQKHDNVWVFGDQYPVSGLDFYWGAPDTVGFFPPFSFYPGACVSMSDTSGNLLFYTDGNQVGNWNNNIVPGSLNFNYGPGMEKNNYWQGVVSMPYPSYQDRYVLFHYYGTLLNGGLELYPTNLYYSVIDMSANGGEGLMMQKNVSIANDIYQACSMQATKHANGRDWWVIIHKANSDEFKEILFTPNGVEQVIDIAAGPSLPNFTYSLGQSVFSPDGSMFAIAFSAYNCVYLFDFDRCTGNITFRDSSAIVPYDQFEWFVWGCSFSPNSRFLYANTDKVLYQYDTWIPNLASSKKRIGINDGFFSFFRHCTGPDGKIYMTGWNGGNYPLHVINNPDEPDTLCNLGQHQLQLVSDHWSTLPEFPNYRLGAINGSQCDTVYTAVNKLSMAEDFLYVKESFLNRLEIRYRLSSPGNGDIYIFNVLGEIISTTKFSIQENELQLDASAIHPGIYFAVLHSGNVMLKTKFTVQ